MKESPLDPPAPGSEALGLFLAHFGLEAGERPQDLLAPVVAAFARLPYENLTKILKIARECSPSRARRWPREVISDHIALGTGGTCFSLTAALLHLLRALGFRAEPLLADRRYGPNTHCALSVWMDGAPHLLDPGFLLTRPVPLDGSERRVDTGFNEVVLSPLDGGRKLVLSTLQEGKLAERLTFKASPADPGEFLKAWDESFGWDMMRYPLLNLVRGGSQVYLHRERLQVRRLSGVARTEVGGDDLASRISREFGIDAAVVERALEALRRQGEGHGGARGR